VSSVIFRDADHLARKRFLDLGRPSLLSRWRSSRNNYYDSRSAIATESTIKPQQSKEQSLKVFLKAGLDVAIAKKTEEIPSATAKRRRNKLKKRHPSSKIANKTDEIPSATTKRRRNKLKKRRPGTKKPRYVGLESGFPYSPLASTPP
jgi:hypothetical protein